MIKPKNRIYAILSLRFQTVVSWSCVDLCAINEKKKMNDELKDVKQHSTKYQYIAAFVGKFVKTIFMNIEYSWVLDEKN